MFAICRPSTLSVLILGGYRVETCSFNILWLLCANYRNWLNYSLRQRELNRYLYQRGIYTEQQSYLTFTDVVEIIHLIEISLYVLCNITVDDFVYSLLPFQLCSVKISERRTIFSRRCNLAKLCIKSSVMITNNNTCTYLHLKYWSTNWHFRNLSTSCRCCRTETLLRVVLVSYNENLIALKEHTNAIVSYISYDKALFAQSPFVIRFQLWRSNCCRFVGSMCQVI